MKIFQWAAELPFQLIFRISNDIFSLIVIAITEQFIIMDTTSVTDTKLSILIVCNRINSSKSILIIDASIKAVNIVTTSLAGVSE